MAENERKNKSINNAVTPIAKKINISNEKIRQEIEEAFDFAKSSPFPDSQIALEHVYA